MPSDIITEKLLRDGKLKQTEKEVDDALESRFTLRKSQGKPKYHLNSHRYDRLLYCRSVW